MSKKPQEQLAVVAGGRGALGAAVIDHLLAEGYRVVGVDLSVEAEGVSADETRDGLSWMGVDLADASAVGEAVASIEAQVAPVDVLVNCAGGFRWTLIGDASDDDLDFLIDANLRSSLYLLRALVPGMKERGYGRVVLISSKSTLGPSTGEGPYAATKAALNALVKSVAAEVTELDVSINAVLPSIIDTEANRADMPDGAFERWVKPAQIARIIGTLCGQTGDPINGALLPVTGRM